MSNTSQLISHSEQTVGFDKAYQVARQRIEAAGDKPHVTVARQLEMLDQLSQFSFGRFLIEHQGVNGYWTHYMLTHPWYGKQTGKNSDGEPLSEMELFILEKMPLMLATQERFTVFLQQNQVSVRDGAKLACIPCGMMGELLYLDFSDIKDIELFGIDYDPETLKQASDLAVQKELSQFVRLQQQDAWTWCVKDEFDLISSNGLNIYEPDSDRVQVLYQKYYRALKPGGRLVTSFMTAPPTLTDHCEWDFAQIDQKDGLQAQILFMDVLQAKCQSFHSSTQTRRYLESAGFANIDFIYDKARMFPTVVAYK